MSQRKHTNTEWLIEEVSNGWILRPATFRDPGRFNDPEDVTLFLDADKLVEHLEAVKSVGV